MFFKEWFFYGITVKKLLTHLIPAVTIVTVNKVFIYKALKTLLTDVLVTSCKYGENKGSQ